MASGQERVLRRRIRSVQSTKKITRAMELIAASRIVRAQQGVAAARPYSERITEVLHNLAAAGALDHPILRPREEVRGELLVVVTADRGLAGGYNASVLRVADRGLSEARAAGRNVSLVVAGRKAESYFRYRDEPVAAAFSGFSEQPRYEDARRIGEAVLERYGVGEADQVDIISTRFLSLGTQRVVVSRLLPLPTEGLGAGGSDGALSADYEFEPSPEAILERLLDPYVEARIFAALLDAAASEHAARQRAMKAATDNAEELIKGLSIVANKVRQAGITTEIMEIVGGAEALRQASGSRSER
ncbi:MAG: F0F1 ATP synthase subunit gamma [Acidimicrobiales bacterium]